MLEKQVNELSPWHQLLMTCQCQDMGNIGKHQSHFWSLLLVQYQNIKSWVQMANKNFNPFK